MLRDRLAGLALLGLGLTALATARGDEFERIEGDALFGVARNADAKARKALTLGDLDALPTILRDSRSPLLLVKTDQGNVARLLVSPALRKPQGSGEAMGAMSKGAMKKDAKGKDTPAMVAAPFPVLVLERFDTFDASNRSSRLVHGKDLILFDGFHFDLDSGQVVPEGQGGDLQFLVKGEGGPRLVPVGNAVVYTLAKPPAGAAQGAPRPSPGRLVVPTDFNGRYRLFANGQWSGTLDLSVAEDKTVTGRFRSDLNGASYPIEGQVGTESAQKIAFRIKFPRAHQDYEGLLWTEGKGAMAGTLTMLDRAYGFFAVREGARYAPEGEDLGPLEKASSRPNRKTVSVHKGQYTLDGKPQTDQELSDALKRAVAAESGTWVVLQVPEDESFADVRRALDVINAAGVVTVRLAPGD
ncbi:MAG: biopolymer transporter ExbD [Isosphaeraceae bacterium]|nr:biopolymer transporter ExbD [Isosphaeraceae bacterium]